MTFFELDKRSFEVSCPNGHKNTVTIGDVKARKTITCRSCGTKQALVPDASFTKTVNDIQRELNELKKTLDNFGR